MKYLPWTVPALFILVFTIAIAREPAPTRDDWPIAGITWMITRPAPGAPSCEPGTAPTFIGANMTLEIYKIENHGGYPTQDILVEEVPVDTSGIVRWRTPMRPGTGAWFRCRTKQWHLTRMLDPDTVITYGCWSPPSYAEVPLNANRWGPTDPPRDGGN